MKLTLFYFFLIASGLLFYLMSPLFPDQFPFQLGGGLVFWMGVAYLVMIPLRGVISTLREGVNWGIFLCYLAVHYVAYSLLLDRILGISPPTVFSVTYAPMSSVRLGNALGLFFSPSVTVGGSWFYLDLSFFSILMGMIIGLLVVGNIVELRGRGFRYNLSIVGLPLLGIVSGSTCCISIATVVAYYTPALALESLSPVLDVIYVGLPVITAVFLWMNFMGIKRLMSGLFRREMKERVRS
ncbi:hypothetical protein [Metallosphaera javensis (ex Sakai et al. 2022)]|uniref:hypothetical protein n=1 Tax=Metallosphaera javensis (ex Sakai et al. 2022) TaxID=2775498 RepID=UPI00258ACB00|nr:MAG: hypothetical protein MjAS7_0981 [Metallosphaera javensis (ex Sakai et al. 2022)]